MDTVCDLQRQAEQMSVMRSPWAPGLRTISKSDLPHTQTYHIETVLRSQDHVDKNKMVEMQEKY